MFLAPLTAACLATAAHAYHLPEIYLYAIVQTEGGRVGQAVHNTNGTDDLGPFQINTSMGAGRSAGTGMFRCRARLSMCATMAAPMQ